MASLWLVQSLAPNFLHFHLQQWMPLRCLCWFLESQHFLADHSGPLRQLVQEWKFQSRRQWICHHGSLQEWCSRQRQKLPQQRLKQFSSANRNREQKNLLVVEIASWRVPGSFQIQVQPHSNPSRQRLGWLLQVNNCASLLVRRQPSNPLVLRFSFPAASLGIQLGFSLPAMLWRLNRIHRVACQVRESGKLGCGTLSTGLLAEFELPAL